MLRILGSTKTLCDGIRRRDLLQAGAVGITGLGLADLLRAATVTGPTRAARSFGKAKACIVLFLYGSPSQLETFDVKPDAPENVRGDFKTIASALPGYRVGELLPKTAQVVDRTTIVRSLTHPYPIHGVAYAMTGVPTIDVAMELNPHDTRHWPYVGSVVDWALDQRAGGALPAVPRNLALPWPFSTHRTGEVFRAGPYPAFLGAAYQPVWTQFEGKGTKSITKTLRTETIEFFDPYMGVAPDCRFTLSGASQLPGDLTLDRLERRRSLLEQFDAARRHSAAAEPGFDRFQQQAFTLLRSARVRTALNIAQEPAAVRERYGMTLFGQAALAARRLVEAGSRLVTVFWDEYGLAGSGWDTHWDHFRRMKVELCPSFDHGFAGLILDLEGRGLLDETLVVCISEHGRTPKLSRAQGGGRDHWSRAYSAVLAGGGIARGRLVGKTDRIAGDVIETPLSPKDIHATIYHLLGIDPETIFHDRLGRPLPIAGEGRVRYELLA